MEKINLKPSKKYPFTMELNEVVARKITLTADVMILSQVHEVEVYSEFDETGEFDSGWDWVNGISGEWFKQLPEEVREDFEDYMSDEGIPDILKLV